MGKGFCEEEDVFVQGGQGKCPKSGMGDLGIKGEPQSPTWAGEAWRVLLPVKDTWRKIRRKKRRQRNSHSTSACRLL